MRAFGNVLLVVGAGFMLLAAAGLLRLPDIFARMHAGTKAATLGVACILAGTALHVTDLATTLKLGIAIVFQFATAPVAAHVIGRAAYRAGVPLWGGTLFDELRDRPIR